MKKLKEAIELQNLDKTYIEDSFELEELNKRFIKVKIKNAQLRIDKRVVRMLSAISAGLFLIAIFFAYWAMDYYAEINKSMTANEKARVIAVTESIAATEAETEVEPVADIQESVTNVEPVERHLLEKIASLREAFSNDDIIGYLKIDDTNIDYAVVQSVDNEFYLKNDLYGEKNAAGSIFMDFESDPYELSLNTVIYGHNMRNGSMFHNLRYFASRDYWQEHRYILLTTPYEETTWEIFAFYNTSTDFNYIQVIFPDDVSFAELLLAMKAKSAYDTGVEVGINDKILTLSTCANTADDARYVLNAKLIEQEQ